MLYLPGISKYVFLSYALLLKYMIMILDQPLVVKNKERVKRTLGIIVPDSYYSRPEEKDLPIGLSIVTQSRYENEFSIVLPISEYVYVGFYITCIVFNLT